MRARWWLGLALAAACSSKSSSPSGGAGAADVSAEEEEVVRISDEVMKEAGVVIAPVTRDTLAPTLALTGEVAADPDRTAQVPVRVPGRLVAIRFQEGDRVTAGQPLAAVESSEMARVRAELGSAMARAKAARQRVTRLTELASKGLAPRQDVEAAEAEAGSLEADIAAARQTLSTFGSGAVGSARLELRAPIAGHVMRRDGVLGQAVEADHMLAEITDLDQAVFVARLYERDLARVAVGARAEVRLKALPDQVFPGAVETIGRQLDPVARVVVARIRITNHDDLLKLGLFGTAEVTIAGAAPATPQVVVPLAAVIRIGERDLVFVERAAGELVPRAVRLGRASRDRVEILEGLDGRERIAVAGVHTLEAILLKASFGEEE